MYNVFNNTSVRAAGRYMWIIGPTAVKDPGFPGFIGTDESNSKRYSFVLLLLLFFVFLYYIIYLFIVPAHRNRSPWRACSDCSADENVVGRCDSFSHRLEFSRNNNIYVRFILIL